ncbi:MAG: hypothetical protein IPM29_10510 [Planctomycetes bacterium]|nr:hypothetical protein [Planctomycetota bacterium]
MTSPADRDALLAALLAGEVDAADPEVAARLAADPELAATWAELLDLDAALHASAAVRDEALAAAADPTPRPDDERFLAMFRAGAPRAARGAPLRMRRRLWTAAAAVVVLGLALLAVRAWRGEVATPPSEPGYTYLGSGGIEVPAGLPFGELRFELTEDDPLQAVVDVSVFALDAAGHQARQLAAVRDVTGGRVVVPEQVLAGRDAIEFVIEVRPAGRAVPVVHRYRQRR